MDGKYDIRNEHIYFPVIVVWNH